MTGKSLYYDITDGVLYHQDGDVLSPVKTSATLYPSLVKIEDGQLWIKTEFSDNGWESIKDHNGNPVQFVDDKSIINLLQNKEVGSLITDSKTIVEAINELVVKIGAFAFSHTYKAGDEIATKYEFLKTLPAGTYKITADIHIGKNNDEAFNNACLVLNSYVKPQNNASENVVDFGKEFTITKESDIYIAYAQKEFVIYDLLTESPVNSGPYDYDLTIVISNVEIVPMSDITVAAKSSHQSTTIGIALDTDGVYYWALNGEWLLDDNGNKLPVSGKDGQNGTNGSNGQDGADGKDGADGQDGKDGITPQLKIEEGYWYISYDNGATWTQLGKATGEDGKDGKDGANGTDGKDGQNGADGHNPFTEEEVSQLKTLPETIINLQSRITALEQALLQIDLSGLSVAYPKLIE